MKRPLITTGRCSHCGGAAERGRTGGWWHNPGPCPSPKPLGTATFVPDAPEERQQPPPRNRQISHPAEDR